LRADRTITAAAAITGSENRNDEKAAGDAAFLFVSWIIVPCA
jgi:hypothetical protein